MYVPVCMYVHTKIPRKNIILILFPLQALEYQNSYEGYAYLWVGDRQEFLRQFLLYGHVLTPEEIEVAGEEGVAESPPSLGQFKEQVDTYEKVYGKVEGFEVRHTVNHTSQCSAVQCSAVPNRMPV